MKRLLLLILLALAFAGIHVASAQPYVNNATAPTDPAHRPLPASERGVLLEQKYVDSKMYPGTSRTIKVFVPKAYDGKTPACLFLCADGIRYNADVVIDNLIRTGELPMMIGVFVEPGSIMDADGKPLRYNRSNEFDRCDGKWASFLETEILPLVEGMKTPDGRPVLISKDPNDRMIAGNSSGGIAAFTAAWNRPDLFSRVFTSVGTYVAMRGGNEYPALVRKTEPKPLRIFLQDGMNDAWNPLFGSWWEQNQLMESALDFAGYELNFKWGRGKHSGMDATLVFPDAMRWMWKDYPARVKKGKSLNNMLTEILDPDTDWELLRENVPSDAVLAAYSDDAVLLSSGKKAVAVDAMGTESKASARKGGDPLEAVFPGGRILARSVKGGNWIWQYVKDADGAWNYGEEFYWIHGEPGQIAFDTDGLLYVATATGVQVCDHNGRVRAILSLPSGKIDSLAFAGRALFVLSGGSLYVRLLKHRGFLDAAAVPMPKSQGRG